MTTDDLNAVCKRHGIVVLNDSDFLIPERAFSAHFLGNANSEDAAQGFPSPSSAICALLKARYGITTVVGNGPNEWGAYADGGPTRIVVGVPYFATEIAAVASVANKLISECR